MPAERLQAGGPRLIRPLLDLPRSLLAAYAEENALHWVEDESNADSRHRRNHLRRQVMPRIEERFPGAAQVLVRAGRHFAEAALLLEELWPGWLETAQRLRCVGVVCDQVLWDASTMAQGKAAGRRCRKP